MSESENIQNVQSLHVSGENITVHHYYPFPEAVVRVAQADPGNIQEVAASQLAIINSYYQSGLQQSQQSFRPI